MSTVENVIMPAMSWMRLSGGLRGERGGNVGRRPSDGWQVLVKGHTRGAPDSSEMVMVLCLAHCGPRCFCLGPGFLPGKGLVLTSNRSILPPSV
jgi:hypothetical protein